MYDIWKDVKIGNKIEDEEIGVICEAFEADSGRFSWPREIWPRRTVAANTSLTSLNLSGEGRYKTKTSKNNSYSGQ